MDLSIIIVNWRSKDFLRKCLSTVYANTSGITFEVIVVDSASFDGCEQMLKAEYPHTIFVQSAENVGFARANNIGCSRSKAKTLLFLNPDTELQGSAIDALYRRLWSLPKAGAVGAKLLNTDGSLQTSCVQSFPTLLNQALDAELLRGWFPRSRLWGTAALFSSGSSPASVEVLSGACIMIKRHVFERAGKFPEAYFMYSEDLELCFQVRQTGFLNYYIPEAVIVHHGGGSSNQSRSDFSSVMMRESVCRFLTRTRGRLHGVAYRATMLASAGLRLILLALAMLPQELVGNSSSARAAARKWLAILKWGLGRHDWISDYR